MYSLQWTEVSLDVGKLSVIRLSEDDWLIEMEDGVRKHPGSVTPLPGPAFGLPLAQ